MLKGIQTAVAVMILICLSGVSTVHAQVASKQLTSFSVFTSSCKTDPQEFLYALRNGPRLGVNTSAKDSQSGASVVFASSRDLPAGRQDKKTHFQTEIIAKVDGGTSIIETTAVTITPTVTPNTTQQASSIQQSPSGLDPEVLFSMANSYRASLGLSPFQKDAVVCEIAAGRGPELNGEMVSGTMHAGLFGDNHPFWVTENMISMRTNEEAFNWWLHSPVHRGQLQGNFKYACAVCSGNTCALVFTNYVSK